jgi:hypothetical protein
MKYLKTWRCVSCDANQPITGEYPTKCWTCDGLQFIRDEITIPDGADVGTEESEL